MSAEFFQFLLENTVKLVITFSHDGLFPSAIHDFYLLFLVHDKIDKIIFYFYFHKIGLVVFVQLLFKLVVHEKVHEMLNTLSVKKKSAKGD